MCEHGIDAGVDMSKDLKVYVVGNAKLGLQYAIVGDLAVEMSM